MKKGLGHSHEQWCEWIKEQQRGNEMVADFCRARDLAAHNFHYHKKRMNDEESGTSFIEVAPASEAGLRLIYEAGSWHIDLGRDFDASALRRVVEVLR